MNIHYLVKIENPHHHHLQVSLKISDWDRDKMTFFLPSWSPGSYLMREYSRNIRWIKVSQENGEELLFRQLTKSSWQIDGDQPHVKKPLNNILIEYEVYAKDLTVRTSHIDSSHAFLHGPSYLMGVLDRNMGMPSLELRFPSIWSKISTGLRPQSSSRDTFLFIARNYDELIDCPIEVGCHETDGFEFRGKDHALAFYGTQYKHSNHVKNDIQKIVQVVSSHFSGDLPYDNYLFLTHFVPKIYGGLEHLNSTALHFDGRKLGIRKEYLTYLSLVAHEYFHLWNVKRIRPIELGPFDYLQEGYTSLLWLAEGLTSFMDDLFVYRAGLSTLEEYLDIVRGNIETYYNTPGRRYHSLEQSSFNAWIKLYRPDENSKNSSISYYLKGGLVFNALLALLFINGHSVDDLLNHLWSDFLAHPERGVTKDDVYLMIKKIAGDEALSYFQTMVETTEEIDFDLVFKRLGCELKWSQPQTPWIGVDFEFSGERAFVKHVQLDSPAFRSGLNTGDEIISLNGLRFLKEDADKLVHYLQVDTPAEFLISRLSKIQQLEIIAQRSPRQLKEIIVLDRSVAESAFKQKLKPEQ